MHKSPGCGHGASNDWFTAQWIAICRARPNPYSTHTDTYERNLIMKNTLHHLLARSAMASILFVAAAATASAAMISHPHGSNAHAVKAMRVIKIGDATKAINVSRGEVVQLVNAAGETFTWHFDTLHHPVIALNKIAPAGFAQRTVLIYVGQGVNERS